ncbi:MAG: nucleotidyltransferase domain-containing protein [Alkalispirochaeta sp.]
MNQLEALRYATRHALEPFENIAFVFLFGSAVSDRLRNDSDLDVAVYGTSGRHLEIETDRELTDEAGMQLAVERETGINVDLLVLNRAPAAVCTSAVTTGVPVFIRDESILSRYLLAVTDVAIDFLETERDWRAIRARSASLSRV